MASTPWGDALGVSASLCSYGLTIVPVTRRELARWRVVAESIPHPDLRRHALSALTEKSMNVEAIAVFGTLVPRPNRRTAVRAMAALQIIVDYLDTLGEDPTERPLENGLQLHRALPVALTPEAEHLDWYRFHPHADDGGYLDRLVAACQELVHTLPSQQTTLPLARRAATRCGEGQSQTHAAGLGEAGQLREWALRQDAPPSYRWWEVAAGASSSVAAHALIAACGVPGSSAEDAARVDAAYFPPVGALTVLLDDLIDMEEDATSGDHNYMAYYASSEAAAERLASIAISARQATEELPNQARHAAILAGVVGFYLSAKGAETPFARPIRRSLLEAVGPSAKPITAVMGVRRRIQRGAG